MNQPIDALLQTLSLTDTGARTREDIFTGRSQWMPHGRVFGGQVLAQSVVAASRTVSADRPIHSMHGYFLRPGDISKPITFSVDRIHDGRSFTTRRSQAYQNGLPILSMIASFQRRDAGLEHQVEMPEDLPDPDSIPEFERSDEGLPEDAFGRWDQERPFDIRHIPTPVTLMVEGAEAAHHAVWMRSRGRLSDDPNIHRAALAYASDYTLLEPILRRHGVSWGDPTIRVASLDHAMWWHRDGRVDDWFLYVQQSPTATSGRGLSLGHVFTRSGSLIATVAQEGMIRVPARGSSA